jgi:hypothetical protein
LETETPPIINKIDLYPNPAIQQLNVKIGSEGLVSCSIVNVFGRKIISEDWFTNHSPHMLDISSLAPGIYTIKCDINGGLLIEKFVVIK